jgi:hypothetical protein
MTHMSQLTQGILLFACAALGLGTSRAVVEPIPQDRAALELWLAPATATYRCRTTPESPEDVAHWLHTRSAKRSFSGIDAGNPRASSEHALLLADLRRDCRPAGAMPPSRATAWAFDYEFTLHAPAQPIGADGVVEVWWSSALELPLVIVRQRQGRTIVDELVHLSLEERADLLVR